MDCRTVEELLAEYLAEEIDANDRRELQAHLDQCTKCRDDVAELRQTLVYLESLETVSRESAALKTRFLRIVRQRRASVKFAIALLKAAAVLAFGVVLGRWTASNTPAPSAPTPTAVMPPAISGAAPAVHPDWITLGDKAQTTSNSFVRQLVVLAKAGAHNSEG